MAFAIRPGQVTRFCQVQRGKKVRHDARDPRPGRGRWGSALLDGMPYAKLRHPLSHIGDIVRDRAAAQSPRPQPLAVAGPPTGPDVRRVDEVIAQAGLEKVPG
jgi:ABC-2 type transport system ATP-binding protein